MDSEVTGGRAVDLDVIDEQRLRRVDAEPRQRQLVDLRLGLARPDERGVDDVIEDLVDREFGAPPVLPLAHVVRADCEPVAASAQLAHELDHRLVRVEVGEVALPEAVEADLTSERAGEGIGEQLQEPGLGHAPGLKFVQRVGAVLRRHGAHRGPELLERDA